MQSYEVGIEYYFREIGQKVPAGSVITLRAGDAERYMMSHPGLLKPVRHMAVASPKVVRAVEAVEQPVEAPEVKVEGVEQPVEEQPEAEKVQEDNEPKKRGRAKK